MILHSFFDVYLAPLVKELQQLWRGLLAYDISKEVKFWDLQFESNPIMDNP